MPIPVEGGLLTVTDLEPDSVAAITAGDLGSDPRVTVRGNIYAQNGFDPARQLRDLGLSQGEDVVWDASNWNNSFDEPKASVFPPLLPGSAWPDFSKRSYWKILDFAIKNLL